MASPPCTYPYPCDLRYEMDKQTVELYSCWHVCSTCHSVTLVPKDQDAQPPMPTCLEEPDACPPCAHPACSPVPPCEPPPSAPVQSAATSSFALASGEAPADAIRHEENVVASIPPPYTIAEGPPQGTQKSLLERMMAAPGRTLEWDDDDDVAPVVRSARADPALPPVVEEGDRPSDRHPARKRKARHPRKKRNVRPRLEGAGDKHPGSAAPVAAGKSAPPVPDVDAGEDQRSAGAAGNPRHFDMFSDSGSDRDKSPSGHGRANTCSGVNSDSDSETTDGGGGRDLDGRIFRSRCDGSTMRHLSSGVATLLMQAKENGPTGKRPLTPSEKNTLHCFIKRCVMWRHSASGRVAERCKALVGVEPNDLRAHLTCTAYEEMCPSCGKLDKDDRPTLDFVVPLSKFTVNELFKACHYTNLQIMSKSRNEAKGGTVGPAYGNSGAGARDARKAAAARMEAFLDGRNNSQVSLTYRCIPKPTDTPARKRAHAEIMMKLRHGPPRTLQQQALDELFYARSCSGCRAWNTALPVKPVEEGKDAL